MGSIFPLFTKHYTPRLGLPWWLSGRDSACQAGDTGLIPGSERSPGEGNDSPLQYSCLGNPMDRGAWWDPVHRVAKRVGHDLVTKQQHIHIHTYIYIYIYSGSYRGARSEHTFLSTPSTSNIICMLLSL